MSLLICDDNIKNKDHTTFFSHIWVKYEDLESGLDSTYVVMKKVD